VSLQDIKISVIVLNWNGPADTLECLESLAASQPTSSFCVIVVDNDSTDDSLCQIQAWLNAKSREYLELNDSEIESAFVRSNPGYVLIRSRCNKGYAGGNNLGIRFVQRHVGSDYILVLNNDTVVAPRFLDTLVAWGDANPNIGIFGPTIIEPNRRAIAAGARYYILLTTAFPVRVGSGATMDYVSGAAMVVRSRVIEDVGLLNDKYFLYYEELDYAVRAKAINVALGWCPSATVFHKKGRSTNRGRNTKTSLAEYYANLSCLIFTAQFYPSALLVSAGLRMIFKSVHFGITGRFDLLSAMFRAYRDFVWTTSREQSGVAAR
jgi:GT2 family glycosyltransferase